MPDAPLSTISPRTKRHLQSSMDHLLKPLQSNRAYCKVPYVCTEEYDGGDFAAFPERHGWSPEDLRQPAITPQRSLCDIESFVQTWLYFGLLHAFFGSHMKYSDFIHSDSDGFRLVTTSRLLPLSESFCEMCRNGMESFGDRIHDVDSYISKTHSLCHVFNKAVEQMSHSILLSVVLLADYLKQLRWIIVPDLSAYSVLNSTVGLSPLMRGRGPLHEKFLDQVGRVETLTADLIGAGWTCPAFVRRMEYCSVESRLYMAQMAPLISERKHTDCTVTRCNSLETYNNQYIAAHAEPTCHCKFLHPDEQLLNEMSRKGDIALISGDCDFSTSSIIPLQKADGITPYVAISHVWADGLGNPGANAMYICQLKRISAFVKNLCHGKPTPFWVDTICCPKLPDAKSPVLANMRKIYSDADKVLVLDRLMLSTTSPLRIMDCFLLLYASGWSTRLWTLQEGAVSKTLWIQCGGNETIPLDGWMDFFEKESRTLSQNMVYLETLVDIWKTVRGYFDEKGSTSGPPFLSIRALSHALKSRALTFSSDEPLCLGALLGLPTGNIARVPLDDRFKEFWRQVPKIPVNVLFSTGLTLAQPGYRWAPATLLSDIPWGNGLAAEDAVGLCERGLLVRTKGCVLHRSQNLAFEETFGLLDGETSWRHLVTLNDLEEPAHLPSIPSTKIGQ